MLVPKITLFTQVLRVHGSGFYAEKTRGPEQPKQNGLRSRLEELIPCPVFTRNQVFIPCATRRPSPQARMHCKQTKKQFIPGDRNRTAWFFRVTELHPQV